MKIACTCTCGAKMEFEDSGFNCINEDGKNDENNNRFVVQKVFREWLNGHENCVEEK